jgi:BASS family bile acid:Na+ symporter
MMYGVSLKLTVADFARVARDPRPFFAGMGAQFVVLPAATALGTWALDVEPQLSLGMILVAACPGGAFSNIMTWRARGDVALSVSMTAVSSLVATLLTPLNFAFWGGVNPHTRAILQSIEIPAGGVLGLVALVLALPLVLGMLTGRRFPAFVARSERPLRAFSLVALLAVVAFVFARNFGLFLRRFDVFFWLVAVQNGAALALGALISRSARLSAAARRAVTLEVGIQNSGHGLLIILNFFPTASGMLLITAFWGVWHLVSGLLLSGWWGRRPLTEGVAA